MIKFSKLLPNTLYRVRNGYSLPFNDKNRLKGNVLCVFGNEIKDTEEFFDSPYWIWRYYYRYHIDRRVATTIVGMHIRIKNDQETIFANGIGEAHPDMRLCITPSVCRDFNTIYEINQYSEILNQSERINRKPVSQQRELKISHYLSKMQEVSAIFPNHKKYLMIPVHKFIPNTRNASIWTKMDFGRNFLIQFIRYIGEKPEEFKKLKNWTFVFNNLNEVFYIDTNSINSETFEQIKVMFKKFKSRPSAIDTSDASDDDLGLTEDENEENLVDKNKNTVLSATAEMVKTVNELPLEENEKEEIKKESAAKIKSIYNKTSLNPIEEVNNEKVEKEKRSIYSPKINIDSEKNKKEELNTNVITKTSENKIITKDSIKDAYSDDVKNKLNKSILPPQKSIQRLARIEKMQKEMKDIKVGDETIKSLAKKAEMKKLEPYKIKADTINENIKYIPFNNFEKGYNKKLYEYDLTNILTSFAEKDRPLYLISLNKEDTSTTTDKLYTYKAVFEDENGTRHNLTFDMPKMVDNKFIHINGSDKLFVNQIIPLPITKVSPDEVQVSSSYNKVFIRRFGRNVSTKINKFHKIVPELDSKIFKYTKGNNVSENSSYMTTIEYDELSSKYSTIYLPDKNITFYFNQAEIRNIINNYELDFDNDTELPVAIIESGDKQVLITININSDTITGTDLSLIDYIINILSDNIKSFKEDFDKLSTGKKFMYTRATIMAKKVPMVLLLGYLTGLVPLMERLNLEYEFSEKRPISKNLNNKSIIQFKDGYLIYTNVPFSNSLLMNGLYDIPTEEYNFLEFSDKDVYFDLFTKLFGRRNIGNAFDNFNQLFVDPITKEILEDHNLPSNFIDIMIYANSLLENNTFDLDGDLKNYRVRSNELLNTHLYKLLSKAYENYRVTADNRNPVKFSIKKDDVIKDIFDSQILEEYSTLNPIFEIDRMRATSYKGPGGCNVDRAFNIEKRAFNPSMLGILAQSSPISSNIGIARVMSLNPNIVSLRGYIQPGSEKDIKNLNMTNMLSGAELLVPMTATHDDAQRVSMASTQSRHTISTIDSDTPLFGYGFDKVLGKTISDRFAFKAKEDGFIKEYNNKLGYLMIEYKSGKTDIVDLTNKQALNTGSGFYINNKLDPIFKEPGKKFKEGDILACNKDFFKYNDISGDVVYTSGPLARVAIIHGSCVFEDSTLISERLADRMSSYITEKKDITIGKNSNIYSMVNIGDEVKVGDPLLVFDESYSDEYLNSLLAKMNEKDKDDIINAGRTPIKSKVNGKVIDIKLYYLVPKSECSATLQKVINKYEAPIKERLKIFNDNGVNIKDLTSLNELPEPTVPQTTGKENKIKGIKMNENDILIEFYIQTLDKFSVGDKCTYACALKGINQGLIPKGEEPYIQSDPNEKIDAMMSVSGYYSRMTNSFALSLALNNLLLGAEKKIKDILDK